jgi:hypothetical protein
MAYADDVSDCFVVGYARRPPEPSGRVKLAIFSKTAKIYFVCWQ